MKSFRKICSIFVFQNERNEAVARGTLKCFWHSFTLAISAVIGVGDDKKITFEFKMNSGMNKEKKI
jgi:hypothetical protein